MKTIKSILLSTLFTGAILIGMPSAHGVKASLATLDGLIDSVNADLATGKMTRIHHFAESMNEAVKDLDQDSTLDPVKKKRVQGYIKNIAKLTDSMHDAADEKKLDETKKWAKKLQVQADLLDKQFKAKGAKNAAMPKQGETDGFSH